MEAAYIKEPTILIRINKTYMPGKGEPHFYDATRGTWRVGPRKDGARLAMSVLNGTIRAVYEIAAWHQAGSTNYETRDQQHLKGSPERCEFTGKSASPEILSRYVGKSVAIHFPNGARTPFTYVNC